MRRWKGLGIGYDLLTFWLIIRIRKSMISPVREKETKWMIKAGSWTLRVALSIANFALLKSKIQCRNGSVYTIKFRSGFNPIRRIFLSSFPE